MPLIPWAASPSAIARISWGCILVKSATWSKVNAVLSSSQTAVALGISGALVMANLLCAPPTSGGETMVIGDDWNWPYIGLLGSVAQWSLETVLTRLESSPNSLPELTVPCPPAWVIRSRDRTHGRKTRPQNRALFAAGFLRRGGAGHRHRGTGARHLWRTGLCPPRDRPQQICRGRPEEEGRDFRRGTRRNSRQYQCTGGVFGPRGAEIGSGRGAVAELLLARCDLSAGDQGASGSRYSFQARPRDPTDRSFASSRGGGHPRAAAARGGDPDRNRRGCRELHPEGSEQPRFCHADDAVDRRHRRHRRDPQGSLCKHLRSAQGRHLLCHHQPPACGQEGGASGRRADRGRRAQLVELSAPARSRRARGLPDRGAGPARR